MTRFFALALTAALATTPIQADTPTISWTKQVVDPKFRSEGVAVADANKDGKLDILTSEIWYEGPDFKKSHEMQKPGNYGDGLKGYSRCMLAFAADFNGDGWVDAVIVGFPGEPCFWLENPKGQEGHWKKHPVWHSACNETPLYKDLFGNGQRVLIMGFQPTGKKIDGNEGQMAYFTPRKDDPTAEWEMHPISEAGTKEKPIAGTQQYSHGLGVGDMNGDGRLDVMTSGTNTKGVGGWWEQPAKSDGKTPWKFHTINFGDACADMFAADLSGTGKMDILCTSAHYFGIWHLKARDDAKGETHYTKTDLFPGLVSETHAAHFVDIDGDGLKDLVTGKRYYSHGNREKGWDMPAMIYWFQAKKGAHGAITFTPQTIDKDSGIGTQFEVVDLDGDGLLDIVVSNKKGTSIVRQSRK